MFKSLAFNIPGANDTSQEIVVPGGIPNELRGGTSTSGIAVAQLLLNTLSLLVFFAALVFIIYAGIRFITSGGDEEALASARKQLLYAIVGIIIASLAFFLVRTLITVLGGNPDFFFKF